MQEFKCPVCGKMFKRYACQVVIAMPMCSRHCRHEWQRTALLGKNNPNYRTGICVDKSWCSCGKEKDVRSEKCAICANCSFPVNGAVKVTTEQLLDAVASNNTIKDIADQLKISRPYATRLIKTHRPDTSHFKRCAQRPYTKSQLFRIGDRRTNGTIKAFLREKAILDYKCSKCGLLPLWEKQTLVLELDHKNGNPCDNRLCNLRFLCPNCHSQTPTSKGKNCRGICKKRIKLKSSAVQAKI
jgi:hypothetical protein